MAELKTKWTVECEHNKVLQLERNAHINEISTLSGEIHRMDILLQTGRDSEARTRIDLEATHVASRQLDLQSHHLSLELK